MTHASDNYVPDFAPGWGFFLDVDGTLLDIAPRPEDVRVTASVNGTLSALCAATGGAVALVSGRSLGDLDRLFAPLHLPLAALHGVERRAADDSLHHHHDRRLEHRFRDACARLADFAGSVPGLLFEDKGLAAALHYRGAPAHRDAAEALVREIAAELGDGYSLQAGKMVFEIKPSGRDKGTAIREFMREPPFAGRTPVFIGDDATDEDGFRAVIALGGHAVKVGRGASVAPWRLLDSRTVLDWVGDYARRDGGRST